MWVRLTAKKAVWTRGVYLWRIQDFTDEGAPTLQGAQTYNFAKFPQKLHEIERIWAPGGGGDARPKFYYVDPPLFTHCFLYLRTPDLQTWGNHLSSVKRLIVNKVYLLENSFISIVSLLSQVDCLLDLSPCGSKRKDCAPWRVIGVSCVEFIEFRVCHFLSFTTPYSKHECHFFHSCKHVKKKISGRFVFCCHVSCPEFLYFLHSESYLCQLSIQSNGLSSRDTINPVTQDIKCFLCISCMVLSRNSQPKIALHQNG